MKGKEWSPRGCARLGSADRTAQSEDMPPTQGKMSVRHCTASTLCRGCVFDEVMAVARIIPHLTDVSSELEQAWERRQERALRRRAGHPIWTSTMGRQSRFVFFQYRVRQRRRRFRGVGGWLDHLSASPQGLHHRRVGEGPVPGQRNQRRHRRTAHTSGGEFSVTTVCPPLRDFVGILDAEKRQLADALPTLPY